ncbi:DNA repair protein RecO [Virgibacillus profundi]|uniref:DNA repair protein RecO n=1 Tax=Virgibacillus profundi TaxID=2024555 RepID=A0A2A2ID28_9BACI|nr:DNA repair protein RecO [Virgibacillus profundi]PAV29035.1 DNA repair protein RecO [Virgibacillus profundi]PXY53204.1 DNA repair protein RecO [Virgibacillus profundi]
MLEKINGIIIKTKDYGETHKIVTIFSKKLGKFTALARGAKKPKSRMAAVTQPFIYGEFFAYVNSGLSTIQQGEVIHSFRGIREDIIKTAYTAYITELTDKLIDSKSPDIYLYDQLYQTMSWISDNEDADIPIIMYELKLFKKGGFAPTVDRCTKCGSKEAPFAFSIAEGGLLCNRCRNIDNDAIGLPNAIVKLLYVFVNIELDRVGSISVKPENKLLMRQILDAYYDQYGGFYLKSRKFLNQLDLLK